MSWRQNATFRPDLQTQPIGMTPGTRQNTIMINGFQKARKSKFPLHLYIGHGSSHSDLNQARSLGSELETELYPSRRRYERRHKRRHKRNGGARLGYAMQSRRAGVMLSPIHCRMHSSVLHFRRVGTPESLRMIKSIWKTPLSAKSHWFLDLTKPALASNARIIRHQIQPGSEKGPGYVLKQFFHPMANATVFAHSTSTKPRLLIFPQRLL